MWRSYNLYTKYNEVSVILTRFPTVFTPRMTPGSSTSGHNRRAASVIAVLVVIAGCSTRATGKEFCLAHSFSRYLMRV